MKDRIEDKAPQAFGGAAHDMIKSMLQKLCDDAPPAAIAVARAMNSGCWLQLEVNVSSAGLCDTRLNVCAPSGERVVLVRMADDDDD